MNQDMEIALLRKLLKQTTAAYEDKLAQFDAAQQALRASEARLSTILDNIDAYVYLKDRDGRYLYVNEITRKLWGVCGEQVIGRTDTAFFDAPTAATIRENDRLVLDAGQTLRREECNRVRGSDDPRIYLSTKMPLRDADGRIEALLGVSTDITERVRAEEQVRLAALVYDTSSEAIMVTDADDRVVAVNPAFAAMTGHRPADVIGRHATQFDARIQPADFYAGIAARLDARGAWKGEIWYRNTRGERVAMLVSVNTVYAPDGAIEKRVALYSDITEKKLSEEAIWHQANFDELTTLPNRRLFMELLDRQIKSARRSASKFSLMFLDLDGFKEINDTLGHDTGDVLLQRTAQRIRECVRETDIVARLGGDEFVVVLPCTHADSDVERAANAILADLRRAIDVDGQAVYTSTSIGITIYPDDAQDAGTLLKNADQAMYAAKRDGRSRYTYFQPAMQEEARQRMHLANELRMALGRGELRLVYQPIVTLADGDVCRAEALLRWDHPELGEIPPDRFIPLAEEIGLIGDIGRWVVNEVHRQLRAWRDRYRADFQINVNKSPIEFRDDVTDPSHGVSDPDALATSGDGLVIEVTESTLIDLDAAVSARLRAFRDAGIQVAVDDFGTGYSSLAYLQRLNIDYLKIDQSFVGNLESDATDLALTEAIVVMAHRLGLKVVAEGVETAVQADLLRATGCDYAQGYHFAHPLPAGDFETRLLSSYAASL